MQAILADDMEHEAKLREALRNIASAEPALASAALDALKRNGVVLQSKFNEIAERALQGSALSQSDRRKVVGLVRVSEPESFDAMMRCRMSKEQLTVELPARARRAGFTEVSRYVRWILFGSGEPDMPQAEPPKDNWNDAVETAIAKVHSLGGRPRIESILRALEELKK